MKNVFFVLAVLFSIVTTSGQNSIYDLEHVATWANASSEQKKALELALKTRNDSLEKNIKGTRKAINTKYYNSIESIFKEPQKKNIFMALVSDSIVNEKHKRFLSGYNIKELPKAHANLLKKRLLKVQTNIASLEQRYKYNKTLKTSSTLGLNKKMKDMVIAINQPFKKSKILWDEKASKCPAIKNNTKKLLINYQFYLNLADRDKLTAEKLNQLAKDKALNKAIDVIASCQTNKLIPKFKGLQKQDSITRVRAKAKVKDTLKGILKNKLANLEKLDSDYKSLNLKNIINQVIKDRQDSIEEEKEQKEQEKEAANATAAYEQFMEKANKAQLSNQKANTLWQLIVKRNEDLNNLKESKKAKKKDKGNDDISLIQNSNTQKPQNIKKDFQKKVIELLSLKEYSTLLGSELRSKVNEQAKQQLSEVLKVHKLDKDQTKELLKRIRSYYYNKAINTNYYKYDKKKLKQKLSVLLFYFEKDYRKLMEGYGIDIDNARKKGDSSYEW